MPSTFPASNDNFTEPSQPETTPLSSAGTGTRNHPQHHQDLGDAIEKIEENVPLLGHDHSGTGPRPTEKLNAANTHQNPDTDSSPSALHHTLGTGGNQAARGNHTHNASEILGIGWVICTSTTRPTSPHRGMVIYETDRHRSYVWDQFFGSTPRWTLLPIARVPVCRLVQGTRQQISFSGSVIEWRTEEEDTFDMFHAPTSLTTITIPEPGLYDVNTSVAWSNNDIFGDWAETIILINGQETYRRNAEFIRGKTIFNPGKPQTVEASGKIRFNAGDTVGVKAKHNWSGFQWTFSSTSEKQDTRIDVVYTGP